MEKLYAAYGSNLNIEQMGYRCPTAKIYGKGMIHNHRLLFKGMPDSAYLTIESCRGKKVPVLVCGAPGLKMKKHWTDTKGILIFTTKRIYR